MYYLVQVYAVDGTYHGSSVKGFMSIENQWGTESYRDMWWPRNRSGHWSFFATEYDDGEMEMGYLLCFEEGARGVSFVNDRGQEVFGATSVHVAPEVDADGNATRIRYTADDHPGAWEWIREPDGVRGGWVQRVGETRGVVRWVGANGFYGRGARVPPTPQP
jgi:hypothetical protein